MSETSDAQSAGSEGDLREGAVGAPISIWVNGELRQIHKPSLLPEVLRSWGQDPRTVAVELNGSVIRRATFGETLLQDGDRLEIVRFVQGG